MLNYKIMVSKEYPIPSQYNCDYNLQGNIFSFECDNNTGYFTTQECFYFSIYSNDEAIIRIHVNFGANSDTFKLKEQVQSTSNSSGQQKNGVKLSCFDMSNSQLKEEVKYIMEKRRKKIGEIGLVENLV